MLPEIDGLLQHRLHEASRWQYTARKDGGRKSHMIERARTEKKAWLDALLLLHA